MLQSLIAIDSLPSDLSGPEVVWILHSLPTLRRFSDRSHETFSGHHYRRCCLTKRGEADSFHVCQFFYRCADSSFYDASPFLFRQPISVSMMPVHFCFSVSMMPVHFCTKNQGVDKWGSPSRFINQPRSSRQRLRPHHEGAARQGSN